MISVIIPTLNEEKYLPLLLESVRTQTFQDFEVIVSDAGSKDKTKEIAEKWGCKIVKGGLPSIGRNNGAKIARGEILFFFDSDVVLPKEFLEQALNEFKKRNLDVAGVYVQPLSDKDIDSILYEAANVYFKVSQFILPQAAGHCIIIKRKLHEKIGGFDEEIKVAEDFDYAERASQIGKFRYLEKVKIPVAMRRLDRDGRMSMALKYAIIGLYFTLFGGVRSNIFNYKFAHYGKKKKTLKEKIKEVKADIKNGIKDKK